MITIMESSTGLRISEKMKLEEILDSIKSQSSESKQEEEMMMHVEAYNFYKTNYRKNIQFHPLNRNLCKFISFMDIKKTLGHFTHDFFLSASTCKIPY